MGKDDVFSLLSAYKGLKQLCTSTTDRIPHGLLSAYKGLKLCEHV